ncbi:DNA polymerase III subunit delta [Candidatus Pantoea edessiphila]|uniref:DNA polymerase III subunit delta n=1 Tax=Candidatus Pantoea edessiphila TaxID=2044610 RepID=A0A2P5SX41_9GAMM|nr:DNA polymerase III subunit delta [Candidatus Pantoea edessiphila]PPI86899.1 DNA polymerase III subunit delta [Candidatus Pantoea edessiphila]
MIKINSQQLSNQLSDTLNNSYILVGNEILLLNESYSMINKKAVTNGFKEYFKFIIDNNTNWNLLFTTCNSLSLFNTTKIIIDLEFTENTINSLITKQLIIMHKFLHSNILIVCRIKKLSKHDENSLWFKTLFRSSVIVSCWKLDSKQLPKWILNRVRSMNLLIDDNAIQLLCHYYEGNLLELDQAIKFLCLQCYDDKINTSRIKESLNKIPCFFSVDWVNALLEGNIVRSFNILSELEKIDSEAVILLSTLQRDILILIKIYHYQNQKISQNIMDKYNIWKTRRYLFDVALKRLNIIDLQLIVDLSIKIERSIKQYYYPMVWLQFELLSFIICKNIFPMNLSYVF